MSKTVNLLNFALLDKNNEKKTATFEITNDKPNDNGWINRTQGIDLRRFKKARTVTLDHNDELIIGRSTMERMEQVTKNRHRMISEMEFFQGKGGKYTELAMETYDLVNQDMLVGASVELIPYEAYHGEEAADFYKEDFQEAVPKNWRDMGMFGKKYMRESSLAKYSIVATPANMDTLKISNSISDELKGHLTLNAGLDFCEEFFEKETAGDLIFYKDKFLEFEKIMKAYGLEIKNGVVLFDGMDFATIASEKRAEEIRTEARFMAQQIINQLKEN